MLTKYNLYFKFLILILMGLLLPFLILSPQKVAQAGICIPGSNSIVEGLVTTPALQNDISTSGQNCVIASSAPVSLSDAKIAKVQNYSNFKTLYFDQSKLPSSGLNQQKYTVSGDQTVTYFTTNNLARDSIHNIIGDLTLNADIGITPFKTVAVYVNGNLNFNIPSGVFNYGNSPSTGIVFVVNGNINIARSMTRIEAVLISFGTICTEADFSGTSPSCPSGMASPVPKASALVINGSLISLSSSPTPQPIRFRKVLDNNDTDAAEQINAQAKYLVILKDILSSDLLIPIQSQ